MNFDWLLNIEIWVSLLTLTILEIVLGIDNIIVIAILAGKVPAHEQAKARTFGLALALITRLLLLTTLVWLTHMKQTLFSVGGHDVSMKDLVLIIGGLFLLYKATHEIHTSLEGAEHEGAPRAKHAKLLNIILQISLLDIVFSLDSVITAIAVGQNISVMIAAVVIAMAVMLFASKPISDFVAQHPTIKMLALSFLLLIGVVLVADGLGQHIEKKYLYFAMGFSLGVELLNMKMYSKRKKLKLHPPIE